MSTHERAELSRALLGSTAERVVRHAHCSVLTVRRGADAPALAAHPRAAGFLAEFFRALGVAVRLAEDSGARLHLLHVVEGRHDHCPVTSVEGDPGDGQLPAQ